MSISTLTFIFTLKPKQKTMKTILVLLSILFYSTISAQYTFSTFTEDYNVLNEDQNLGVESDWDDPIFNLPLGFDFQIGDMTVNSMTQEGLGAILISGSIDDGHAIGSNTDLIDGISLGEGSFITYQVDGNVGERICKLQYANCAFYDEVEIEGTAENRINFQIWLYESDHAIEFRYGPSNIPTPELAYFNLQGPNILVILDITEDGENIGSAFYLNGNPENPTFETNTDPEQIEISGLNGTPENGRVYRFAPSSLSTQNQDRESFSIYPTIASEEIWVDGIDYKGSTYSITNLTGQIVDTGVLTENRIDVSSYRPGAYLINLGETSQKFIKQ